METSVLVEVLIVVAHPDPASLCVTAADDVRALFATRGHSVNILDLYRDGFDPVMSRDDRVAYESDEPIVDASVRRHADLVRRSDTLVFIYPTVAGGLPAMLKGWLERVMVMGVAFELHPKTNKVKPAMHHVRRIAAVTTSQRSRVATALVNDAGRRSLMRTLRLSCHPLARRVFLPLYGDQAKTDPERNIFRDRVQKRLGAWA